MPLRPFPFSTLLAGFVAVLVGYASSAAIIWQAASVAGASPAQIAGWMTALGLAMGISTLVLTLRYRVPVLTAWSTPGAALLATSLEGATLNEAVGVFIFANALILLCGLTGLFARLMKIVPHSLAAAMLAGILLRFGLQTFTNLQSDFSLCVSMLLAWLLCKALAPRYAIIAALITGALVAWLSGDVVTSALHVSVVMPEMIAPSLYPDHLNQRGSALFPGDDGLTKRARLRHHAGRGLSRPRLAADGLYPAGWRCWAACLGSTPSVSPLLPPLSVKARMPIRMRISAGRLPPPQAFSICWRACLAAR
ncbi:putative benzoate transporter [Pseudescherichia vulneris]|nr:putative benzoate transporter [Pseudescherichia vulneris]